MVTHVVLISYRSASKYNPTFTYAVITFFTRTTYMYHCIDSVYDSSCLGPRPVNEWVSVNKGTIDLNEQTECLLYSRIHCAKVGYSYCLTCLAVNDHSLTGSTSEQPET